MKKFLAQYYNMQNKFSINIGSLVEVSTESTVNNKQIINKNIGIIISKKNLNKFVINFTIQQKFQNIFVYQKYFSYSVKNVIELKRYKFRKSKLYFLNNFKRKLRPKK